MLEIEIVDSNIIERGIEIFARAWEDGQQLGFGADGTVDVERFLIHNPPVLVDDPTGNIEREVRDVDTGELLKTITLREDPEEALLQSLEHTINIVKKDGSKIVPGKVGNTTTTEYPNAGNGTAPIDGFSRSLVANATLSDTRDDTGQAAFTAETSAVTARLFGGTATDRYSRNDRAGFGFDTSAVGTDTVSSVTFSQYVVSKASDMGDVDMDIVSFSPADEAEHTTSDHDIANWGTTSFGHINTADLTTGAYNDWTLNASGIAHINGSGNTIFGQMHAWDTDNNGTGLTWSNGGSSGITEARMADYAGTTSDPKLVVEHSAAATNAVKSINGVSNV